jgi:hypothetical protein
VSSLLSKAPDGLLGTLDLKNLGRNPGEFGDTLAPSLDCLPFYLLRNRQCAGASGPFTAVGAGIVLAGAAPYTGGAAGNFIIPADQTVRIKSLCVINIRVAADAALTLEVSVYIRRAITGVVGGLFTVGIGTAIFGPHPATDLSFLQPIDLVEPLWLGPGDLLRVVPSTTQTAAGSAIGIQLDMDVVPSG